jgi:hypothetical protein
MPRDLFGSCSASLYGIRAAGTHFWNPDHTCGRRRELLPLTKYRPVPAEVGRIKTQKERK